MHEMMVAQSLFGLISAETEKQNAKPVNAKVSCGVFSMVNDELLRFAFETIAKGTSCEGLKLQIEHKPLNARCKSCDKLFEFDITTPACPKCRCKDFELLPDEPLMLEDIEFQTE